ncbi:hypothetical protein GO627_18690 [Aeromonas veronii]|nr:hypothetical protein GO627_18690 [Aeromonas veronii]
MRLFLLLLSLFATTVNSDEKPRLPYYDWGRCPFEGCTALFPKSMPLEWN